WKGGRLVDAPADGWDARRANISWRKDGGPVRAPGGWLVGTKAKYPHLSDLSARAAVDVRYNVRNDRGSAVSVRTANHRGVSWEDGAPPIPLGGAGSMAREGEEAPASELPESVRRAPPSTTVACIAIPP